MLTYSLLLAFFLALVEGFEASLFFVLSLKDEGVGRTVIGALAGLLTAMAIGTGFYFAYNVVSGRVLDYIIAALVFSFGIYEVIKGLGERGKAGAEQPEVKSSSPGRKNRRGWYGVWKAYSGLVLEGTEVILYTIAVGHATRHGSYLYISLAGAAGFFLPFAGVNLLVRPQRNWPEWKQEFGIGLAIATAAVLFTVLETTGVL